MSFLSRLWRMPAFALVVALPLVAVACADDEGAAPFQTPPTNGQISGQVTNAATGAGIVGALVGTSPATTTALTDAQGNYIITNIPIPSTGSQSFAVTASKEGFNSASTSVTLSASAPNATANLALAPSADPTPTEGDLNVLVTNRQGQALSGVQVDVVDPAGNVVVSANTDANGFALFTDLPAGSFTVRATTTISGFPFRATAGVQIVGGETAFLHLTLTRDLGQTVFPNVEGEEIELAAGSDIILRSVAGGDADPTVDCNIIRTQHMFIAEVRSAAGQGNALVSGVKVNWDLNIAEHGTVTFECPENDFVDPDDDIGCSVPTVPGNTGTIVDTDDPDLDPGTARTGVAPAFKVDSRHAVTFTNDNSQTVSFGGQSVTVGRGQTWIVITSPVEGLTDVIVSTPDIPAAADCAATRAGTQAAACDKEFAVKRWVNWDISVHEVDWPRSPETVNSDPFNPGPNPNPVALGPSSIEADLGPAIADGGTITNVLARREADCTVDVREDLPGIQCEVTGNQFAIIGVVARLRLDSPFNFARGIMRFDVVDDTPDIDFWGEDGGDGNNVGSEARNAENNGPTDNEYVVFTGAPFFRNRAEIEFDANNNIFDGGVLNLLPTEDEDDFIGWGIAEIRLDPAVFFCTDVDGDGDCEPASSTDEFSDALQRLFAGTADNEARIRIQFRDIFGEVCGEITVTKRFISSRLRIIKSTPDATLVNVEGRPVKTHTVQVGQTFSYTVTVVNVGEAASVNVRITDTLPRFGDQFSGPPDLGAPFERNGAQAFEFVRDRPTFDPRAVVYAIDEDNDDAGDTIDVCIRGDDGSVVGNAYVAPAPCAGITTDAGTVGAARAAAIGASGEGDQVVWIQWFDDRIARGEEPEDSVEVFLLAPQGNFAALPGTWCNIATVTDGSLNRAQDDLFESFDADTLCHRVVEALLDIRKTTQDAVIPAATEAEFRVEISNAGSAALNNVVIADTLDAAFADTTETAVVVNTTNFPGASVSGFTTLPDGRQAFTVTIPTLPANTPFREAYRVFARTPGIAGVFCNRVTVRATTGGGQNLVETDLACVTTVVAVELDVSNDDGFVDAGGVFQSAKEIFTVGESGNDFTYQVIVTNQSTLTATGVRVVDEVAPNSGIFEFQAVRSGFPTMGSVSGTSAAGFTWTIGSLAGGESAELQFHARALRTGDDVNRVRLTADQLTGEKIDEEPTTVTD